MTNGNVLRTGHYSEIEAPQIGRRRPICDNVLVERSALNAFDPQSLAEVIVRLVRDAVIVLVHISAIFSIDIIHDGDMNSVRERLVEKEASPEHMVIIQTGFDERARELLTAKIARRQGHARLFGLGQRIVNGEVEHFDEPHNPNLTVPLGKAGNFSLEGSFSHHTCKGSGDREVLWSAA